MERGEVFSAVELDASLPGIEGNMRAEFAISRKPSFPKGLDSLNLPALARIFQLVEQNAPPCEMIHDECATFESSYRFIFESMRDARPGQLVYDDGFRRTIFGFKRLNSLSFVKSEEQPIMRAADYLVAVCVDFARRSFAGDEVSAELAALAQRGLGVIQGAEESHPLSHEGQSPQFGEIIASEIFCDRVFSNLDRMTRPN